jgi:hypothetical protein
MRTKGMNGKKYFMLVIDDYIRMTTIFFLNKKSKAFEHFKIFRWMVEREIDLRTK